MESLTGFRFSPEAHVNLLAASGKSRACPTAKSGTTISGRFWASSTSSTQPHVSIGADFRMIPQFEEKVLEHRDGHYVVQDWMGAITEISDEFDYTYIRQAKDFVTRKWHRFPVQSRADWEERIKPRFDPNSPGRLPMISRRDAKRSRTGTTR